MLKGVVGNLKVFIRIGQKGLICWNGYFTSNEKSNIFLTFDLLNCTGEIVHLSQQFFKESIQKFKYNLRD